jgi:hypothetical protein
MNTIFPVQGSESRVKKIAEYQRVFMVLLDSGEVVQYNDYTDGYRIPPDLLGMKVVDLQSSSEHGMMFVVLEDGSKLSTGENKDWMIEHGYLHTGCNEIAVAPDGHVYVWKGLGPAKGRRWEMCGWVDRSKILKCVYLPRYKGLDASDVYCLTHDGRIVPLIPSPHNSMVQAPWVEESWRYIDIRQQNGSSIHAITTGGQVVTPMVMADGRIPDGVVWPLPGSDAASFVPDSQLVAVVRYCGSIILYPHVYKGWRESLKHAYLGNGIDSGRCTPYPTHIVGKKGGDWHDLAGTMVALGSGRGIERYTPSNLLTRQSIKTMRRLANI